MLGVLGHCFRALCSQHRTHCVRRFRRVRRVRALYALSVFVGLVMSSCVRHCCIVRIVCVALCALHCLCLLAL